MRGRRKNKKKENSIENNNNFVADSQVTPNTNIPNNSEISFIPSTPPTPLIISDEPTKTSIADLLKDQEAPKEPTRKPKGQKIVVLKDETGKEEVTFKKDMESYVKCLEKWTAGQEERLVSMSKLAHGM